MSCSGDAKLCEIMPVQQYFRHKWPMTALVSWQPVLKWRRPLVHCLTVVACRSENDQHKDIRVWLL